MGDRTRIEWTDATWNPIRGCSRVSEGCRHCYAERQAIRLAGPGRPYEGLVRSTDHGPRWTGQVRLAEDVLEAPLRWRRPRRIFVNSMSDLFHENVPDEWIDKVFAVMALAEHHFFQVLTKRPERMLCCLTDLPKRAATTPALPNRHVPYEDGRICEFLRRALGPGTPVIDRKWPLSNVWLGVSVENQQAADERIPLLLQTPAAVRFLSCEPLLGPVDLSKFKPFDGECFCQDRPDGCCPRRAVGCPEAAIDWIIVGGESGPNARPMHPDWVRAIRDACVYAGVPFCFKQWGEYCYPSQMSSDTWQQVDMAINLGHHSDSPIRVGKRLAGALLDGQEWREWPVVAAR